MLYVLVKILFFNCDYIYQSKCLSIYLYIYLFVAKDLDEMDLDELYKPSIYMSICL